LTYNDGIKTGSNRGGISAIFSERKYETLTFMASGEWRMANGEWPINLLYWDFAPSILGPARKNPYKYGFILGCVTVLKRSNELCYDKKAQLVQFNNYLFAITHYQLPITHSPLLVSW